MAAFRKAVMEAATNLSNAAISYHQKIIKRRGNNTM